MTPPTPWPIDAAEFVQIDIRLEFLETTRFHFFHHPAVHAFLFALLDYPHALPWGVWIDAPESGRVRYDAGASYRFGLTIERSARHIIEILVKNLRALPNLPRVDRPLVASLPFRRNVRLIDITGRDGTPWDGEASLAWFGRDEIHRVAKEIAGATEMRLRFLSPTTLKSASKGDRRLMTGSRFNSSRFLSLLDTAVRNGFGRWAIPDGDPAVVPVHAAHVDLEGVVVPRGTSERRSQVDTTLHGVVGEIELSFEANDGLSEDWTQRFVWGEALGVGSNRVWGFGRFELVTATSTPRPYGSARPARTLVDECLRVDASAANTHGVDEQASFDVDADGFSVVFGPSLRSFAKSQYEIDELPIFAAEWSAVRARRIANDGPIEILVDLCPHNETAFSDASERLLKHLYVNHGIATWMNLLGDGVAPAEDFRNPAGRDRHRPQRSPAAESLGFWRLIAELRRRGESWIGFGRRFSSASATPDKALAGLARLHDCADCFGFDVQIRGILDHTA